MADWEAELDQSQKSFARSTTQALIDDGFEEFEEGARGGMRGGEEGGASASASGQSWEDELDVYADALSPVGGGEEGGDTNGDRDMTGGGEETSVSGAAFDEEENGFPTTEGAMEENAFDGDTPEWEEWGDTELPRNAGRVSDSTTNPSSGKGGQRTTPEGEGVIDMDDDVTKTKKALLDTFGELLQKLVMEVTRIESIGFGGDNNTTYELNRADFAHFSEVRLPDNKETLVQGKEALDVAKSYIDYLSGKQAGFSVEMAAGKSRTPSLLGIEELIAHQKEQLNRLLAVNDLEAEGKEKKGKKSEVSSEEKEMTESTTKPTKDSKKEATSGGGGSCIIQ